MGKELLMGHCCGFKVSTERIYEGKNGGATKKLKIPTWVCERCKTQVLGQEHLACEDISYIRWLGDILSQGQIVPLHYAPPRRHIVPTDAPSPVTFCPTFSI